MRIALLSDIHGNAFALDAVLADIATRGEVDGYWVLGDLVALGPDPVGVLEILLDLPNTRFIRGNTDRYVWSGQRPSPSVEEVRRKPELVSALVEVANTFAWTLGVVTARNWLTWLQELPLEMRVTLPDGTRFLGVHASPGADDGPGITPDSDLATHSHELADAKADLLCIGHTHRPFERTFGGVRVVNPGAVSLSLTEDKNACYAILTASATGYALELCRVAYDRNAVIDQLKRIAHPGREYLIRHLSK